MRRVFGLLVAVLALMAPDLVAAQGTPTAEKRIAVVIGNTAYQAGSLNTPANDAGLIAQTLEAAGFDVVGARDLDQDTLRRSFRDFLDKAEASGPNTVAFMYLSGYGLQLEGENYYVPIDARIARESDIAAQAVRISDFTRPLAALKLKASIVVLDTARPHPFVRSGGTLAGGLALVEPEEGMLIAFNAAPDTVAPEGQGPYGPYAQALAEMMREGGLPLADVFDRVRLRVNDITRGAGVPWHASKVQTPYVFFERAPDAPTPAVSIEQTAAFRARPIRDFDAHEAYIAALERDTLQGYLDFLAAYPDDPMAKRVRAIAAARREAITWRRTRVADTPDAYWSYLRRYPRGRHAAEARRRLAFLAAALEPPPRFTAFDYDVPPPPPEEFVYIERRVLIFDDPVFAFAPPPPPPIIFLAPAPPEFTVFLLAPPPPPIAIFVLPIPVYRPVPVWVRPPRYVAPPPANNVIFNNIHNTVVINNTTNVVTVTKPDGQTTTTPPPAQPAAKPGTPAPPAAVVGPALPPSVARKASQSPQSTQPSSPEQQTQQPPQPGQPPAQQPSQVPPGQPLPGVKGVPLLVPPPGTTATGQPPKTQDSQPPQPGQPLPKAPVTKGPPPPGTPQPGELSKRLEARPPPPGQPLPKAPVTKGPSPGTPQPDQPPKRQEAQPPLPGQPLPKAPLTKGPPPGTPQPHELPGQQKGQAQIERQRQQQLEQQHQRQLDQQRQGQAERQRQQQLDQQRQRQTEQQRQQLDQQRQRQIEQQRQQQLDQQRQRQTEQQRQQQLDQQRQRQIEQQRQQQTRQQQPPAKQAPPPGKQQKDCGGPQQPPCPK